MKTFNPFDQPELRKKFQLKPRAVDTMGTFAMPEVFNWDKKIGAPFSNNQNQPTGKNQEKENETKSQKQKTQIHNSDQKEKDLYGC